NSKRLRPRCWIADCVLVEKLTRSDARESLDDMHVRVRVAKRCLVVELHRLDDEHIALPMAARTSRPLRERQMRTAVQGDDACIVDHLVQERDITRSLEDLHVLVVATRVDRWPSVEPEDAALANRSI